MLVFHVGSDGTNDNVHIEICSDVDSTCCNKKLDSYFNDFKSEWYSASIYEKNYKTFLSRVYAFLTKID